MIAEKRWGATIRGSYPLPGWTMRLGDIGQQLGITARAAGKLLDLVNFRSNGRVTDEAVIAGYGVRRWDGDRFHTDWHRDRVVQAVRSAAAMPDNATVTVTLDMAVLKERASVQLAAERKRQKDIEEGHYREQQAVMAALAAEVTARLVGDPGLRCLMPSSSSLHNQTNDLPSTGLSVTGRTCKRKTWLCWSGGQRQKGFHRENL